MVALISTIIILVISVVAVNIFSKTDVSTQTKSVRYYGDPFLIKDKINNEGFLPIGIATNRQELEAIAQEYADQSYPTESQVYQEELYSAIGDEFNESNYLAIGYNDACTESFVYEGLNKEDKKITVNLTHEIHNGGCAIRGIIIFIEIPKNITRLDQVTYNISRIDNYDPDDDNVYKPIIYIYPETETELNVTLGHPENLTTSYPKYQNGWRILAHPDGTLTDTTTGRELYSLYWEGTRNKKPDLSSGFVVKGRDSAKFLEEKLAYLGLNPKEAEEFIVYWLPKLESSPYNIIKFEDLDTIESIMPLTISQDDRMIVPDTLIRIWMAFQAIEQPINIPEQQLPPSPHRHGFTVVEWGGTDV